MARCSPPGLGRATRGCGECSPPPLLASLLLIFPVPPQVVGTELRTSWTGDYTVFVIAVLVHTPPAGSYQLQKRYSEFTRLHTEATQLLGREPELVQRLEDLLPPPAADKNDPWLVGVRRRQLHLYLSELADLTHLVNRPRYPGCPVWLCAPARARLTRWYMCCPARSQVQGLRVVYLDFLQYHVGVAEIAKSVTHQSRLACAVVRASRPLRPPPLRRALCSRLGQNRFDPVCML